MNKKLDLNSLMWILGIFVLWAFTYLKFEPTDFFRVLLPILIVSSFAFLGILASGEMNKKVKEHYSRQSKNILKEIKAIQMRQENKTLDEQIKSDEDILDLRRSLKGFVRNYFERCVVYSAILFSIAFLSTFIDIGSYLSISNLVVMVFFSFWGLFYFSKMFQSIFVALNIVELD